MSNNSLPDSELEDNGIKLIFGDIESELAKDVVEWIIHENYKRRHSHLTLVINSNGGNVTDCFAIIDIMRSSNIPIRTIGLGAIYSCGLLLFMAGEKGHRILSPNTDVMSHQFSSGVEGKLHDLISTTENWNLVNERFFKLYRECTSLKDKEIRTILLSPSDKYITPKEAIRYGIADAVKDIKIEGDRDGRPRRTKTGVRNQSRPTAD